MNMQELTKTAAPMNASSSRRLGLEGRRQTNPLSLMGDPQSSSFPIFPSANAAPYFFQSGSKYSQRRENSSVRCCEQIGRPEQRPAEPLVNVLITIAHITTPRSFQILRSEWKRGSLRGCCLPSMPHPANCAMCGTRRRYTSKARSHRSPAQVFSGPDCLDGRRG
jgi:hypothetical protein